MRDGFTLVEVLVALVVLEVGLLGVAGTVVLASRILAGAEDRERALTHAGLLLDSLEAGGGEPGTGTRQGSWGELAWTRDAGGRVVLEVTPRSGRSWRLESRVALPGAGLP